MRSQHVPVLIVGAGPVGLCLSADLSWRGIPSMTVEQDDGRKRFARIMLIGVRTMEICRRLGIVEKVKNWGFPLDFPMDNVWVTSLAGYELGRGKVPSIGERQPFEFSPEFHGHCPQSYLEPILEELVRTSPGTNLRYRHKLDSFVQDEHGVSAVVRNLETDQIEEVTADYLVGCDGFGSTVRKLLGIKMRGDHLIDYSYSIEFVVKDLVKLHDKGNAGRYAVIGPEGTWATILAVDGRETWRMLLYTVDEDIRQVDPASRVRRFIGHECDFKVTDAQLWARRAVMADRFSDGRVFLAGDSGHTHVPNGGFGMNMGMADATNLGWKIAAVLQGWGHPNLLDSYDIERRPICHRTMDEAKLELDRVTAETKYPAIEEKTPAGDAARAAFTDRVRKEYEGMRNWGVRAGIHLGHVYDPSPIVVADGTPPPEDDTWGYSPTSYPGARAPHAWLGKNKSTLDLFERNFVLLRFGEPPSDAQPLAAAAARRSVALDVHDITDPAIVALYERRLVLVRPDGHVAWRGDTPPADPLAVIDRVRGAGSRAAARVRVPERQRLASVTP